jgi:HAMP domain-containing protein
MVPEREEKRSEPHIYIGLRLRFILLFSLLFGLVMAGLYAWLAYFGMPMILDRARTAYDIGVGVSSVALDQTTVRIVRENFIRALEFQAWQNMSQAGLGAVAAFFLTSIVFIILAVAYAHRNISALTEAARQIAQGNYDVDLSRLYQGRFRSEISELARAVEESGRAHLREQKLQHEVVELKIEIDNLRRSKEVSAIVETDDFKELKRKAAELRQESAGRDSSEK